MAEPTKRERMAQEGFNQLARDLSLQGSLTARGYVPLLEWAADRAYGAASMLDADVDPTRGAAMIHSLLRRLVQAAVWAAEVGDANALFGELASCPEAVIHRELAVATLSRLPLSTDDANGNAEAIAGALRAATPFDQT